MILRAILPALVFVLAANRALFSWGVEGTDGYFQTSDSLKIHYIEAGRETATGNPVVLIHGYTGTARGNWFTNGVAEALAKNHWVIAIDCRGHGNSDKPHDADKYGPAMARDVIELMDHLKIPKAHIHGYSMGGAITGQLLAKHPERFITASFGGSGIPEVDPAWKEKTPADKPGPDPQEAEAREKLSHHPDRDEEALAAVRQYPWKPEERSKIDLTIVTVPVLAINGEFDGPNAKTARMQRELKNFKGVVLPGKSHLTAIMAGYIPREYIDELVAFLDANDKSNDKK
ncbi:MAG TPA: alpha/beta hydrolase [Pirellulales bacterium]|nr:alpha/beta hydrolase [Pirellulales bacterium]